ncbi:hypothetical protein [Cesiribacter sp. SM1]|uniref:hypothetical protein n=1 Tax=Cesiribacter sp. SM1 TaxID=2861196 RepID=UPI001CD7AB41|nr:hypothetical protein [Cesiribacter sp. SM1]
MVNLSKISEEGLGSQSLQRAFDGIIPLVAGTCAADGTPNITFMSQFFYVDEQHVAISYQFMNKTWRNLNINPIFTTLVTNPDTMAMWKLKLQYVEEQKEGPIFEEMEMQLMALSTPENINFSLRSAVICRVLSIENVFEGSEMP